MAKGVLAKERDIWMEEKVDIWNDSLRVFSVSLDKERLRKRPLLALSFTEIKVHFGKTASSLLRLVMVVSQNLIPIYMALHPLKWLVV